MTYRPVALDYDNSKGQPESFCVIAVVNGVAAWAIYSEPNSNTPVLMMPDYETFISMFDDDVIMVKHPPVKPGTPWDGTKFIEEDRTGFVEIGKI